MAPFDGSGVELSLAKLTFDLKSSPTPLKVRGKKRSRPSSSHNRTKRVALESRVEPALQLVSRPDKLSRLEQLPFDIIERIFLECSNVHLPRAVPLVGVKLSNSHTYNEFCRRLFCLSVRGPPATTPSQTPSPSKYTKSADCQRYMEYQRRLCTHYRSLALQSHWASFDYFKAFQELVAKSDNLWFGSFSCYMPSKLLRWPLSPTQRRFFLALATAGATVDPNSLDHERAMDVWDGAVQTQDMKLMQCLVERGIGRLPSREERVAALKANDYSLDVMRTFRLLRRYKEGREWSSNQSRTISWPEDWPKDWPESDPEVSATAMERLDVGRENFAGLLNCYPPGSNGSGETWRTDFKSLGKGDIVATWKRES